MEYDVDAAVSRCRNDHASLVAPAPPPPVFQNPERGRSVRASDLLQHLDLNLREIREAFAVAYPVLRRSPTFLPEALARVRFVVWMTLKGFRKIAAAHRALLADPVAMLELGFTKSPSYESLREFRNDRLPGATRSMLERAVLAEAKRLCPTLGDHQVQDGAPIEARRNDKEARYSGYYGCRAYKMDIVWDVPHEAYLGSRFMQSTDPEALLFTPLQNAGIHATVRTVDGNYTSFSNIALAWRAGTRLRFRAQKHWRIDVEEALQDVKKRYQGYRKHREFQVEAPITAQVRFLIDHGTPHDIEACGRYLRDHTLKNQTPDEDALLRSHRSQNEGLNSELNILPLRPDWRGELHARRRHADCTLTLLLLQLVRLQHGITTGLCRVSYIV